MSEFHDDSPWNQDQISFESPELSGPGLDESGATATKVRPKPETKDDEGLLTPWNVVLLDDDHHTYEYVMRMVGKVFGHSVPEAFGIAQCVDGRGSAICVTTHKELAELKVEQIHSFGPDPLMTESAGSMSAIMEPAEADGDDDHHNHHGHDGSGASNQP